MSSAPLNDRQLAFCREYAVDGVGYAAAVRAGYAPGSADQTAVRLLKDPRAKAEIARLMAEKQQRTEVKADEIVLALADIMRADIRDVLEWGTELRPLEVKPEPKRKAKGKAKAEVVEDDQPEDDTPPVMIQVPFVRVKTAAELPRSISGAIAEVSLSAQGTFKVKMHDKGAAIDKLMRHLGLYEADNKQKTDPLAELIKAAQGNALPVASRQRAPDGLVGGDDE